MLVQCLSKYAIMSTICIRIRDICNYVSLIYIYIYMLERPFCTIWRLKIPSEFPLS